MVQFGAGSRPAVIDVTHPEVPGPASALYDLPNVFLTPHIAGNSDEGTERLFSFAGDQVRRFAAGQPLRSEVPRYLLE